MKSLKIAAMFIICVIEVVVGAVFLFTGDWIRAFGAFAASGVMLCGIQMERIIDRLDAAQSSPTPDGARDGVQREGSGWADQPGKENE